MIKTYLPVILAFILGSIPSGVIIAKIKGVNLKKIGSGNIGATNVLRAVGKGSAVLTLMGDILKGTAAVAIGRYLSVGPLYEGILGLSAILGHNFSVFLRFRGGKGVATGIGVLLIYTPQTAILTLIIWLAVALMTRYSSLGAILSFGLLPINVLLLDYSKIKLIISVMITLLILSRHIGNIKRLLKGTERKIGAQA
ncbi:MAG: glycerol-3-phosphate 1-O-acyltransferase PlsY [Nitrospirae bacterium]|nr:glycerol-3-phosphate 1-O-acyltransferase PlsY [Nitrospirota bacterium]